MVEGRPQSHDDELGQALAEKRFAKLYRQHGRSVLAYALRRAEPEDAADVAAETFLVAWRRLDEVPDGDRARLWLYGVAGRALANQRRGALRRLNLAERLRTDLRDQVDAFELPDPHDWPVLRALAQLDQRDRELLLLSGWEGLSPRQIARVLDVSVVAARSRLFRARARLMRLLEEASEPKSVNKSAIECEEAR